MKSRTGAVPVARTPSTELKPLAVSFQTARQLSGLGLTTLWALAKAKRLELVRVGRRTLIKFASLEKLLLGEAK